MLSELLLDDSFGGALLSAGTAADTDIGIDDENAVTLGNSLYGALLSAGTAAQASVSNLVSHDDTSKIIFISSWAHIKRTVCYYHNNMDFQKSNSFFRDLYKYL